MNQKLSQASPPLLRTIPEAASQLRLGPSTVRSLIRKGELEHVRIGRAVRVPADGLGRFVEKLAARG